MIWLVLVLAGTALFASQMVSSILYFRSWPVSVNVKINYNDTIRFPAVTICNQNAFRTTMASSQGRYFLIGELFDNPLGESVNLTQYNATDLTMDELFLSASHDKYDMIVSCEWDNQKCGPEDFVTSLTDFGVCYTFNSAGNGRSIRQARQTGTFGGLRMRLNVEQYEYMKGPNEGAGMKILVHEQNEIPLVKDFGLAIPPGFHALVAVKVIEVHNQHPPYGKCDDSVGLAYFDHYSKSTCQISHFESYVQSECNCRAMHMPTNHEGLPAVCTLEQYQSCYLKAERDYHAFNYQYDCPVPCNKITYDTSVSYASTSDFDADGLLHSNLTQSLTSRYLHAREVSQRVNMDIVAEDQGLITTFIETEGQLLDVLVGIGRQLIIIKEPLGEMMSKLFSRVHFHFDRGLEELEYIMAHDFVRGWEVMEERYLNYVTANFYDVPSSFWRLLSNANQSLPLSGQQHIKRSVWLIVDNMLMGRAFLASAAKENITRASKAYKTGDPLLKFAATIDRRYDMSYISLKLLQEAGSRHDDYYERMIEGLDEMLNGLYGMQDVGQRFVDTGQFDQHEFDAAETSYISGCKAYNYRVFQFRERIIRAPVEIIQGKIDDFLRVNRTLSDAYGQLLLGIHNIETAIYGIKNEYGVIIEQLVRESEYYLNDSSVKKTPLSEQITSKKMTQLIQRLENFFSELRTRAHNVRDAWTSLQLAVEKIWLSMLQDNHLDAFYQMIHEDYVDFVSNSSKKDVYLRIFASMLRTNTSVLDEQILDYRDFLFLINADFHNSSSEEKLEEIHKQFSGYINDTAISEKLQDIDDQFLTAFQQYQTSLATFLQNSRIDISFYRDNFMRLDIFMQELSYEEIIQQRAYDITSLLSDIGGSLGLFVGASVLSIFEFFDVILHTGVRRQLR